MAKNPVPAKKQRLYSLRTIHAQTVEEAYADGRLDVLLFVAARAFEVRALEQAQLRLRYASNTRVFQQLPRTMRRRGALHNVKRMPKRLRARALREMAKSDVPGKGGEVLHKKPQPRGRARFHLKMRQTLLRLAVRHRLLRQLPPATMARANVRTQIKCLQRELRRVQEASQAKPPLNNSNGAYDNCSEDRLAPLPRGQPRYMKRQQEYVWLALHVWHTKRAHMVKRWGFQIANAPTQKCFRAVHRGLVQQGGVVWDTLYVGSVVVELPGDGVAVFLEAITGRGRSKQVLAGVRTHHGMLYASGQPVAPGSVWVVPGTSRVLVRTHPLVYADYFGHVRAVAAGMGGAVVDSRFAIGSVEVAGPAALGALAGVLHPVDGSLVGAVLWRRLSGLADVLAVPVGTTFLFSVYDPRLWGKPIPCPLSGEASMVDCVIEAGRGAGVEAEAGVALTSSSGRTASYNNMATLRDISARKAHSPGVLLVPTSEDSRFPVVLTKTSSSWTMLLPWFWVLPVWHVLVATPHLRLGGLRQHHQIAFEQGRAAYPADYPFLRAGFVENEMVAQELRLKWTRKPASKRVQYHLTQEVGDPFKLDWRWLQLVRWMVEMLGGEKAPAGEPAPVFNGQQRALTGLVDIPPLVEQAVALDNERVARGETLAIPVVWDQTAGAVDPQSLLLQDALPPLPITPVAIVLAGGGHLHDRARVYAVPPAWDGESSPLFEHLVGFVTSGTFHLGHGRGGGNGYVHSACKALQVVVRNVGETKAWLAAVSPLAV